MNSLSIRHAPLGADASFDFGPAGAPAGFAVPANVPPVQQVYVGCRQEGAAAWSLLPFFTTPADGPRPLPKGRYGQFFALAGDKWMIGPLVFKVCTPFPDALTDESRFLLAPVVCGYLEYDNSHSDEPAELIFGLSGEAKAVRAEGLVGFDFNHSHGFATAASIEVELVRDQEIFGLAIGPAVALRFRVPAHSKRIFPLVFGFYQPGFASEKSLPDLVSILQYGLANHARYLSAADGLDAVFMRSALAFEEKSRLARDVRAWLAETRCMIGDIPVDLGPLLQMYAKLRSNG